MLVPTLLNILGIDDCAPHVGKAGQRRVQALPPSRAWNVAIADCITDTDGVIAKLGSLPRGHVDTAVRLVASDHNLRLVGLLDRSIKVCTRESARGLLPHDSLAFLWHQLVKDIGEICARREERRAIRNLVADVNHWGRRLSVLLEQLGDNLPCGLYVAALQEAFGVAETSNRA
jgi:hypothetical protein